MASEKKKAITAVAENRLLLQYIAVFRWPVHLKFEKAAAFYKDLEGDLFFSP